MNSYGIKQALELFLALFALYSPLAALPSYLPILGRMDRKEHLRLAVALFINVAVISLVFLWIGEKLLVLLGITTAALSATGGIALIFEAVPLMLGLHDQSHTAPPVAEATGTPSAIEATGEASLVSWQTVAFLPVTFPLTIGGATIGLLISFRPTPRTRPGGWSSPLPPWPTPP